jgi:hypothetical protein
MPKVQFRLEEQFADRRSNEVAYKFTMENLSSSSVELLSITPRIPEDVRLIEIRDPSFIALKSKHNELCEQLENLLLIHMELSIKEFRDEYLKFLRDGIKEIFSGLGFISVPFRMLIGTFDTYFESTISKAKAFKIRIENHKQAEDSFNRWQFNDSNADKTLRDLYEVKLQQLDELEKEMGPNLRASSLATIESESFFAITYVLKFQRNRWDSKKYNIAIEGVYSDVGKNNEKRYVGGATTSLTISPSPTAMTLVAIVASVLGLTLKIATSLGQNNTQSFTYPNITIFSLQAIASIILALIFFNIYEFTDLGKKIGGVGIGWRSALFIGALCGLFGDRILAALKTLLGI